MNKKLIFDISQNNIDPSNISFFVNNTSKKNNNDFFHLDVWDANNNTNDYIPLLNVNKYKNNIKRVNNELFNMKLETILEKVRKNREKNYDLVPFLNVTKKLDNMSSSPLISKNGFEALLEQVKSQYDSMQFGEPLPSYRPPNLSYRRNKNLLLLPPPPSKPPPPPMPLRIPPTLKPIIEHIKIDVTIDSLEDLIQLCKDYPLKNNVEYNINMKAIHDIREPLTQLDNMVGMKHLKSSILDQILYFIQELHKSADINGKDFMHTVIYGPPGTGKTEIAKIMGRIFSNMGVLKKRKFKKATRADFIAGYLGQTALKTKDLIKECLGGVLFIDEAYALGNSEKRDSFAKECIDTLCEALSDHKDNLMVIIAGYEDELKNCFFNYNQGLDSRFTWRFKTTDYSPSELRDIFNKKVSDANWKLKKEVPLSWFKKNKDYFKFFGRDMETLFAKTKIAHGRRIFCKPKKERKLIIMEDLDKGFNMYCQNDEVNKRKNSDNKYSDLYL